MAKTIHLGFEVPSGDPVAIPLGHLAVTGQTQQSGKTTTLEALIQRSGLRAIAFVTKRDESGFSQARTIQPFFRSRADWQFVSDILESTLHEKLKFQRSWIMKVCRGARSLKDVQQRVQKELAAAKRGLDQSVYTELEAYLELVIPELDSLPYTSELVLEPGLSVMDLTGYSTSLQMLVISSVLQQVYERESGVVTIIPEAWEFVPQKRGSPVMRAAEALIRKAGAGGNFVWLDSQDIAGVHKDILKHCSVWVLGVQREENEVQRTLKNLYGLGKNKPKADDVRALGKGEFYACWGKEMKHVYVQPAWMDDDVARSVARRELAVENVFRAIVRVEEDDVEWKAKFETAERERLRLETEVGKLRDEPRAFREGTHAPAAAATPLAAAAKPVPVQTSAETRTKEDQAYGPIYDYVLARLLNERPKLLVALTKVLPEIEVTVRREKLEMDSSTLDGRMAVLIADGFFDERRGNKDVLTELSLRGWPDAAPNVSKSFGRLVRMGFLRDDGAGRYKAVAGMKVNVLPLEVA